MDWQEFEGKPRVDASESAFIWYPNDAKSIPHVSNDEFSESPDPEFIRVGDLGSKANGLSFNRSGPPEAPLSSAEATQAYVARLKGNASFGVCEGLVGELEAGIETESGTYYPRAWQEPIDGNAAHAVIFSHDELGKRRPRSTSKVVFKRALARRLRMVIPVSA